MSLPDLKGRDFLEIQDFTPNEIGLMLKTAFEMKHNKPRFAKMLEGKSLAMLFEKSSLRTRASFEIAMTQLGGHSMYLAKEAIWEETYRDIGQVLGRYADVIMARMNKDESIAELANYSQIPVINGLTDKYHPCQVLADLLTIYEHKGKLGGVNVTYTWAYCHRARPSGVCNSLLFGSAKTGMNLTVACPEGYEPDAKLLEMAKRDSKETGASITVTNDLRKALKGADVVYTKNYALLGMPAEKEEKLRERHKDWIITEDLFKAADPHAIFMHCMPVYRGEEVTPEVVDGPRSVIIDEAENRLHAQKAVLGLITP
jgi:ornithine carbamoyltransferase